MFEPLARLVTDRDMDNETHRFAADVFARIWTEKGCWIERVAEVVVAVSKVGR